MYASGLFQALTRRGNSAAPMGYLSLRFRSYATPNATNLKVKGKVTSGDGAVRREAPESHAKGGGLDAHTAGRSPTQGTN